jgi:alkylhydroperoxidase/carboxymuconolactone decarboxylase family protein YurZ
MRGIYLIYISMKFKIGCVHSHHAQTQVHIEILLENQKKSNNYR